MASYWQNLHKTINTSGKYLVSTRSSSTLINKPETTTSSTLKGLHVSAKQEYPQAAALPLPINIDPTESHRFSPQRARDITSTAIATNIWNQRTIDITIDSTQYDIKSNADPHVDSYDCTGAVSLNSSMQSNVPSPFGGMHKFTHLNMPGGQWEQSSKWMSHDLHSSHYTNLRRETRKHWSSFAKFNGEISNKQGMIKKYDCLHGNNTSNIIWNKMMRSYLLNAPFACRINQIRFMHFIPNQIIHRKFADKKEIVKSNEQDPSEVKNTEEEAKATPVTLTPREKLKKAVKDYGVTVFIFHITISLASLGFFYQLVSSGLDVVAIMEYLGLGSSSSTITNNVASGASTFVVAYAVHKVFAPFRISLTLVAAPFIVRYLRSRGILAAKQTKKP